MRGVFKLRPAFPRYQVTWDVQVVLDKVKLIDNHSTSLKALTQKCVMLLALCSGQRVQTLAALDIDNIDKTAQKFVLNISKVLKTTRPGNHVNVELFRFSENSNICPVACLEVYLDRTASLRGHHTALFISYFKPHKPVCSQTLSRWICITLKDCGVSDSFTAHSTRAASTSKAFTRTDINTVIKSAGWTGYTTFGRFYNKPISSNTSFTHAVLGQL